MASAQYFWDPRQPPVGIQLDPTQGLLDAHAQRQEHRSHAAGQMIGKYFALTDGPEVTLDDHQADAIENILVDKCRRRAPRQPRSVWIAHERSVEHHVHAVQLHDRRAGAGGPKLGSERLGDGAFWSTSSLLF